MYVPSKERNVEDFSKPCPLDPFIFVLVNHIGIYEGKKRDDSTGCSVD